MGVESRVGGMRAATVQDRYVVLAVGFGPGQVWPEGVEVVACDDSDEAMVWLEGSRPWSALVVDCGDAGLAARARGRGVPVFVGSGDLCASLREQARPIRSPHDLGRCGAALAAVSSAISAGPGASRAGGRLVAVCGPGGTGASTVAMAIAAGLGDLVGPGVLLADLALRADQAVLHGIAPTEVGVGVDGLVHARRNRRMTPSEVRAETLAPDGRAYRLLVGLHRPSQWTAIRPMAFDAAVETLRETFSLVVADVNGDLEGEAETGSADVEERNHMARRITGSSDVVVIVGADGLTGRRALLRSVEAVEDHAGRATKIVKVINRPWGGRDLPPGATSADPDSIGVGWLAPDGDLAAWGGPITEAVVAALGVASPPRPMARPALVSPGSIGHWQGAQ